MRRAPAFFASAALLSSLISPLLADSFDDLSKQLAKGASELKNKKVAVLTFPYHDGRLSSGSSIISERLTTGLVGRKGLRVIERALIQQLMSEKRLSQTGVINAENLITIGTVLDADAIVTGTLIDLSNGLTEINARLIRVDSGEVLEAGQERVQRTWKDGPMYPVADKPAPKPVKTIQASPDEVKEINDRREADLPPAVSLKPQLKLSNESFPPERRIYHGKNSELNQKTVTDPSDEYEEDYEPYDTNTTGGRSKKPDSKSQPKPPERAIEHPTKIGEVRSSKEAPHPYYPPHRKSSR